MVGYLMGRLQAETMTRLEELGRGPIFNFLFLRSCSEREFSDIMVNERRFLELPLVCTAEDSAVFIQGYSAMTAP